jgi:hypothetical protein
MKVRKGALPLVGIAVLGLITFAVVLAFLSGISRTGEVVVASHVCCSISTSVLNCHCPMTAIGINCSSDRGICLASVAHEGSGIVGERV